ncbi:MAG: hypothetical protein JST82_16185 [Bacteroidetes bacterium]|nr:hypothetical protein [Bacteroidota bacterium]
MRAILLVCFCFCFYSASAQTEAKAKLHPVIPFAEKLQLSYEFLMKNPLAIASQIDFLEHFPKTKDDFITVFNPDDYKELYNVSHKYIAAFKMIGDKLPDSVLKIGFAIGNQLEWSSGPSDELQHALLTIASNHIEAFVDQIYKLKKKEIDGLVHYLADVEYNPQCSIYNDLVKNLQEAGAYNIAGKLVRDRRFTHEKHNDDITDIQ